MEKINVAELLKGCPKGMELDCTMFENVTFVRVDMSRKLFPIEIAVGGIRSKYLTKEGCFRDTTLLPESKCVIFPKGKTTWKGFVPPCKFKDGDVISNTLFDSVCIFKGEGKIKGTVDFYCGINTNSTVYNELFIKDCKDPLEHFGDIIQYNFATEEEKTKLFKAIEDNGYKWNPETKTLDKLPKFKVGDKVRYKDDKTVITITGIKDDYYFIQYYNSNKNDYQNEKVSFKDQDKYELVPDKFDITALKPFDKVLVRDSYKQIWAADFFSHNFKVSFEGYAFACIGHCWKQCIPYEQNEHLLGKTDDCDEYFKIWK